MSISKGSVRKLETICRPGMGFASRSSSSYSWMQCTRRRKLSFWAGKCSMTSWMKHSKSLLKRSVMPGNRISDWYWGTKAKSSNGIRNWRQIFVRGAPRVPGGT